MSLAPGRASAQVRITGRHDAVRAPSVRVAGETAVKSEVEVGGVFDYETPRGP